MAYIYIDRHISTYVYFNVLKNIFYVYTVYIGRYTDTGEI